MAERIEIVDVTIPAGTLKGAPATVALNIPPGVLVRLEMRWPPGPAGLVGLQIAHSGQSIIPRNSNNFLVTDDEAIVWDMAGYPTGDKWSVKGYNTDINPHTIQFRLHLDEIPTAVPGPIQLLPIG